MENDPLDFFTIILEESQQNKTNLKMQTKKRRKNNFCKTYTPCLDSQSSP